MKKLMLLTILLASFFISCNIDEYEVSVTNKSSVPIIFEFETGYRTGEYTLNPNDTWSHSLLGSLKHKMVSFRILNSSNSSVKINYKTSADTYTFYDIYTVTFNINGAIVDGVAAKNFTQELFIDDEILLPGDEGYVRWNATLQQWQYFGGWNSLAAGTGTQFDIGSTFSVENFLTANSYTQTLYIKWN